MLVTRTVERWKQRAFEGFLQELAKSEEPLNERLAAAFVNHLHQQGMFKGIPPAARDYIRDMGSLIIGVDLWERDITEFDIDWVQQRIAVVSPEEAYTGITALCEAKQIIDDAVLNGYKEPA